MRRVILALKKAYDEPPTGGRAENMPSKGKGSEMAAKRVLEAEGGEGKSQGPVQVRAHLVCRQLFRRRGL